MEVNFLFVPNQRVTTPLGDPGLIDMCAIQGGGVKRYFILMSAGKGAWFDEDQIKVAGL